MNDIRLGVVETRFADIVWQNEPIPSGKLKEICEKELNWKKSTTYTVLKKLCDKGIFKNENGIVSSLITREEFNSLQSRQFVDEAFGGSLPAFIAAFTQGKQLTQKEIFELKRMIDDFKED